MAIQRADIYIDKALDKIVSTFSVERVILFGSFAYGSPDFDSDIDLLVVMDTDLPTYERAVPIRKILRDIGFPFDIIVRTPKEFKRYQNIVGTIVYTAVNKGKTLYEHL
ncbi:MAG: nucleotidyltransferase domain-containing protein [Nitrospirae bacterium]|nr:nucleotidyltransferase domain-containing protein [Nitrospirota bacterium]